jgi:hypothetical protein
VSTPVCARAFSQCPQCSPQAGDVAHEVALEPAAAAQGSKALGARGHGAGRRAQHPRRPPARLPHAPTAAQTGRLLTVSCGRTRQPLIRPAPRDSDKSSMRVRACSGGASHGVGCLCLCAGPGAHEGAQNTAPCDAKRQAAPSLHKALPLPPKKTSGSDRRSGHIASVLRSCAPERLSAVVAHTRDMCHESASGTACGDTKGRAHH